MNKEDLNNTWCEATEENLMALLSYGLDWDGDTLNHWSFLIIDNINEEINAGNLSWKNHANYKEIHLVDEEFQYVEDKPKNNFKEYNFKGDFQGQILKKVVELKNETQYLGYIVGGNKTHYPCLWTASGRMWKTSVDEAERKLYALTPIKKPWYEKNTNFTILCYDTSNKIRCAITYEEDENLIYDDDGGRWKPDLLRPLTKEEALKLVAKEEK